MSDGKLGHEILGLLGKVFLLPREALGWAGGFTLFILFAVILFYVLVFGQIAKRAGFSRWWAILLLIPFVGSFVPFVFAFNAWPVEGSRGDGTPRRRRKKRRSR